MELMFSILARVVHHVVGVRNVAGALGTVIDQFVIQAPVRTEHGWLRVWAGARLQGLEHVLVPLAEPLDVLGGGVDERTGCSQM